MDESALNFNPDADIVELSACIYPSGCTDSCSSNFDPEAITDDGSCDDAFVVYGCTYENALNFNTPPGACVLDDGSCQFTVNLVEGYPCDDRGEHILCVRNESFNTINARITINYDSIFQDHFPNEFMVEEGEGFMVLELDSLIPFENYSLNSIDFQTPTVDFIGELLETQVNYIGYLGEDTLVMGASFLEIPLTCAYDPNDKAGFPLGYTEHHYIENTQELEYLIRFQNTGNAPATDVKILDDIDEDLDLSTLKVIGNSHHVQTLINMDSREVEFLFENIFLPDSVNNESESHGFILFSVLPELENTA